ncbi:hypothetical protein Tco_0221821 [Tanacetum coccineum]
MTANRGLCRGFFSACRFSGFQGGTIGIQHKQSRSCTTVWPDLSHSGDGSLRHLEGEFYPTYLNLLAGRSADYVNAVKALEDAHFPLVDLLKSKKDARMDEVPLLKFWKLLPYNRALSSFLFPFIMLVIKRPSGRPPYLLL